MALQSSYDVYRQVSQFIERNLDPIRRASIHGIDRFDLGELWYPSKIQVYDVLIAGSTVENKMMRINNLFLVKFSLFINC